MHPINGVLHNQSTTKLSLCAHDEQAQLATTACACYILLVGTCGAAPLRAPMPALQGCVHPTRIPGHALAFL